MHYARAGGRRKYKRPHLHVPPICLFCFTLLCLHTNGSGLCDRSSDVARGLPTNSALERAPCVRACVQVPWCKWVGVSTSLRMQRKGGGQRRTGRRVEQNPTPGPHRPSNGNAGDVFEPCVFTVIGWAPTYRTFTCLLCSIKHGTCRRTSPRWNRALNMYVRVRRPSRSKSEMVRAVPNPSQGTPTPALPCFSDAPLAQTALRCAARRSCCAT